MWKRVARRSLPAGAQGAKANKKATRAKTEAQEDKPTSPEEAPATKPKMSGPDAASKVLEEAGEPLNCKQMVERAFQKGYWHSEGRRPARQGA